MPEYTALAVVAVVLTVGLELWWLRTGILRTRAYWLSMIIVFGFQVLVDGWLTKLSAPVVRYADEQTTGVRVPWDIPVEDFAYGFALVTATMVVWRHLGARDAAASARRSPPSAPPGRAPDG